MLYLESVVEYNPSRRNPHMTRYILVDDDARAKYSITTSTFPFSS